MDRRSKIILGIFGFVLLTIIISEVVRPRPIDWRPSYTSDDKIPFGCFVLYQEMATLFPDSEITKVEESVYEVLVGKDTTLASNYLIINDHLELDKQETNQMLDYVKRGNSVFISATSLSYILADTLNIGIQSDYTLREDTVRVKLTHHKFHEDVFSYSRGIYPTYFTKVDTANTTILGNLEYDKRNPLGQKIGVKVSRANFIRTTFGKGAFYFSTLPQAYANYYILGGNQDYVSNTFSYLNDDALYWDNYKKSGRVIIDSPMRFVLNQTALKWTYYLTIIGLVLFVIFRAKREQRIIEIVPANENSSIEFTRTVGSLYFQTKDYSDLVRKKMQYFLAYLRNRYYLDTSNFSERTTQQLASKSGKSPGEVKQLMDYLVYLRGKSVHSEQDIINLNKKITAFKK